MTCHDVKGRLSEWLDREDSGLTAAEREAIAGHLQTCADCRAELAGLEDASSLMRALPRVEAPPYVQGRALSLGREHAEGMRRRARAFAEAPIVAARRADIVAEEVPPRPAAPMRAPAASGSGPYGMASHRTRPRRTVTWIVLAGILAVAAYLLFG